jgi:hypothetical protein
VPRSGQRESPPPAFPNGPSRDPGAKKPLRLYRNPSCAACPGRALPRDALLRAAAAGDREGAEAAASAAREGRPPAEADGGEGGAKMALVFPIRTMVTLSIPITSLSTHDKASAKDWGTSARSRHTVSVLRGHQCTTTGLPTPHILPRLASQRHPEAEPAQQHTVGAVRTYACASSAIHLLPAAWC